MKAVIWNDRIFLLNWCDQYKVLRTEEYDRTKDRWLVSKLVPVELSQEIKSLRASFVMRL